jgi:hypothetical protein
MSKFLPIAALSRKTTSWLLAVIVVLTLGPLAGHAAETCFALTDRQRRI